MRMSTEIYVNNCFVFDFSTINELYKDKLDQSGDRLLSSHIAIIDIRTEPMMIIVILAINVT